MKSLTPFHWHSGSIRVLTITEISPLFGFRVSLYVPFDGHHIEGKLIGINTTSEMNCKTFCVWAEAEMLNGPGGNGNKPKQETSLTKSLHSTQL
jgi:hypothetical protein